MYAELLTVSYSTSTWTWAPPYYLFSVITHLLSYNSMLYSLNYWQHHKIPPPKILNFLCHLHGKIITPIIKQFIRQNTQVNRILWCSFELCDSVCKAPKYLHAAAMFLKQAQPSTEHTAVFMLQCNNYSAIFTEATHVVEPAASKERLLKDS